MNMNNNLDVFVYMNKLISVYGKLLTEIQRDILRDYYEFNLSFQEIAETRNISRSAVSDCIKKAATKLDNLEKALGILAFIEEEKKKNNPEIDKVIERLEERLNGI